MHKTRLLKDGLRLYGQGLGMLQDALDRVDHPVTTETIVSVVSLSLGEVCIPFSLVVICS